MPKSKVQAEVKTDNIKLKRERPGDRLEVDIPTGDHPERFAMIVVEMPEGPLPGELRAVTVGGKAAAVHAWHRGGLDAATEHADEMDEHEQGFPMGGRFFATEMTAAKADELVPWLDEDEEGEDITPTWREKYVCHDSIDGTTAIVILAPRNGAPNGYSTGRLTDEMAEEVITAITWPKLLTKLGCNDLGASAAYTTEGVA